MLGAGAERVVIAPGGWRGVRDPRLERIQPTHGHVQPLPPRQPRRKVGRGRVPAGAGLAALVDWVCGGCAEQQGLDAALSDG